MRQNLNKLILIQSIKEAYDVGIIYPYSEKRKNYSQYKKN